MLNPTGKAIRGLDDWGSGAFKAPREDHIHKGVDFVCKPGQPVYMPINGKIVREARPYAKGEFSGCLIKSPNMDIKMFYFKLAKGLIGHIVKKGEIIGEAQDISKKYAGITPHIHLEIELVNPTLFLDMP